MPQKVGASAGSVPGSMQRPEIVPSAASAVIRTDDGSYRVERRDEAGGESWVTVEIGRSSNGRVEVSGQLAVDDEVVAP